MYFSKQFCFNLVPFLIKPSFTPPGWVIGLVWTILFTLMGISLFLVWRKGLELPNVAEPGLYRLFP